MVEKEAFNAVQAFACSVCGHHYGERHEAKLCEVACKQDGECDPEVHENALENNQ